ANASRVLVSFQRPDALAGADPAHVVLVAELATPDGRRLSRNLLSFAKTKDLALPRPTLALTVAPAADGRFAVTVTTRVFARNVYLTAGTLEADGHVDVDVGIRFEDN